MLTANRKGGRKMKKVMLTLIIVAGLSLLTGILSKFGILPHEFLDIRHHTYLDLSQLFLVAAIAMGIYRGGCKNN
jgi:nucleoid-associated protein YejK